MTTATLADGWLQLDNHAYGKARRVMLHIPRPDDSRHSLCGADLRRATPVTAGGVVSGTCCHSCERAAQRHGTRR